jgi:S-adenosylmethionine decarboxylase
MSYKGTHILADYTNVFGNEKEIGNFVFELMIECINKTDMKIVHKKLCILNDDTPPGFTSVLLLDASHFSSHCYSEDGLLSIDLFTCGKTNTKEVVEHFTEKLLLKYPNIKCTYMHLHERFHY